MTDMEIFLNEKNRTFKFLRDFKQFKTGQYIEIPTRILTGQIKLEMIWRQIPELLENKTLEEIL